MIKKMYLVLVICFLSFIVLACNETKDDDKQNEVKEYNVTFVVDGSETIVKAKEGEKVSKPSDPVKDGYQFIGWYLGSEEYTFNNVTSNITVVAKFTKVINEYTVTFIVGDEKNKQIVKEGESITKPIDPVKDGYNFIGWYQDGALYTFGEVYEDITLTAKFEEIKQEVKEYTVTFVVGDEETKVKVTEGEKVSKPVSPVKDGYNFIGWYQDGALYEFNTIIKEDITLTAKFEVKVIMPEKIVISGSEKGIAGYEDEYTATVYPEGASQEVEWISLDEKLLTVDPTTGTVSFIKTGKGRIRAISKVDPSIKSQVFIVEIRELLVPGFPDLMGYEIVIMNASSALTDIDPFLDGYTKPDRPYKQKAWREIERDFNCDIVATSYPATANWGANRVDYILENAKNNTAQADISVVSSNWIPVLSEALNDLTDWYIIFGNFQIANSLKEAGTYKGYGYAFPDGISKTETYVDLGLYYNVAWLEKLGVEDPAKMFNEGNWNYTNFKNWCLEVQALLAGNQYAIGGHPYYYWLGLTNAAGVKVADNVNNTINIDSDRSKDAAKLIQELVSLKAVDTNETWAESDGGFIEGTTLMTTGKMWFANNSSRWKSDMFGEDTRIGYVPFPYPDDLPKEDTRISQSGLTVMVFNKGKEKAYPAGLKLEDIYFAITELRLRTIEYQETGESFDADSIIYESLSSRISNDESIEAVKWFAHDKVFFEAADAMYSSVDGSTLKNPAINVLFKGASYDDEFNAIKEKFIKEFNEKYVD